MKKTTISKLSDVKIFFSRKKNFKVKVFEKVGLFYQKRIDFSVYKKKVDFNKNLANKNIFLKNTYVWLYMKNSQNLVNSKNLLNPYNFWIFYINYALNYYMFSKLYFLFLNYFFFIIFQKFNKISNILKINKFELCYDFIKLNDHSRYHLGIRPHTFVTTFNRRVKKGSK